MKTIICIVAKTGRGKDTLAKQIHDKLGIEQVCSYTTRPKRDYETDGKEHWFITPEESKRIQENETVLAYAHKPSGVEYFATLEKIEGNSIVYVIDPEGIDWMRKNISDLNKANIFVVELYADNKDIEPRIKMRGDDWDTYTERIANEEEEFETFHKSGNPDVSINALLTIDEVYEEFRKAYFIWRNSAEITEDIFF